MNLKLFLILFNMTVLLSSCSESMITVEDLKPLAQEGELPVLSANDVVVSTPIPSTVAQDSFDISVPISNDENSNSTANIFYCSETDAPDCDPLTADTLPLIKNGNSFEISISGLTSPYDPGDVINYIVVVSDPDGVTNPPTVRQVTLTSSPLIKIYRSVGHGNTGILADHNAAADTISIVGDLINFSAPIVDAVGVGDIIVYDAGTKFAFIHSRTSSTVYTLKKANGTSPPDVQITNNDWEIFRAYTSMDDAENGIENTGITGTPNFDLWNDGRDLVTNNEQWNLALYNDAEFVLPATFSIEGWQTSTNNNLNIYTPYKNTEVGIGQRHNGAWDSSGVKISFSDQVIDLTNDPFVTIEGLKISRSYSGTGFNAAINISGSNDGLFIKNNLIALTNTGTGSLRGISISSSTAGATFNAFNNIIFTIANPLGSTTGFYLDSSTLNSFIYNNTLVGNTDGFKFLNIPSANTCRLKNNLVTNSTNTSNSHSSQLHTDSANNISDDAELMGTNSKNNQSIIYNSKETYDFRIAGNSYSSIGAGLDLSSDPDFPLTLDILGQTRSRWDVGANIAATAIFRSVGPGNTSSLKSTSDRELSITVNSDGHTQMTLSNGTTDLPLNVGVGDVIQYDPDNTGGIDTLAFIHERIDPNNYIVKTSFGANAVITTVNSTSWDLFRAYASLTDAEDATNENSGITASLQNFDTWQSTGGVPHGILASNEQWNFALYADAPESGPITIQHWDTSSLNFIKIFTPVSSKQVGVSQRHLGVWDSSKFHLICTSMGSCLNTAMNGVVIDGIQVENQGDLNSGNPSGISIGGSEGSSSGSNIAKNNIIKSTGGGVGGSLDLGVRLSTGNSSINAYAVNNITYGFGIGLNNPGSLGSFFYYNNTIYGSGEGIGVASGGSVKYLKNNLSFNNVKDFQIFGTKFTENNNSADTSSPDGGSYQNRTPKLFDPNNYDFRVLKADTYAKGRGATLSADPYYAFNTDIKGEARSTWDIGAHAYVNYSASLASWNDLGSGSVNDPYIIANKAQLKDIGANSCDFDSTAGCASSFLIIDTINLNNDAFTPIGETTNVFTGNFNGNSNRIYNLSISQGANNDIGFFGHVCGSTISNIIIEGVTVTGGSNVGAIIGHVDCASVIDNVYVNNGTVSGIGAVGGIAGRLSGLSTISNSTNKLNITGSSSAIGGIVGFFDGGTISDSASIGDVKGTQYVGGAVGNTGTSSNNIIGSHATGNVEATTDTAGGFVGGYSTTGSITNSYALGDIYSPGGLLGGFAGTAGSTGTITKSWSGGDVKGDGDSIGGFIGSSLVDITDSFSIGNVTNVSGQHTGGFIGSTTSTTTTRCYSTGDTTANALNVGGFIGNSTSGVFVKSYSTGNVHSTSDNVGGFGGGLSLGSITDSYTKGNVYGSFEVGGFVGTTNQTVLSRNYSKGSVVGNTDVGGFGGSFILGSVDDSYSISSVSGGTNVGGFLGASTSDLTNNYTSSTVSATVSGFSFIGDLNGGTLIENYWNSSESPVDGSNIAIAVLDDYEAHTNTQMKSESNFSTPWDYAGTWTQLDSRSYPIHKTSIEGACIDNASMTSYAASGSGLLNDPYIICNKNQFTDIGTNCNSGATASCAFDFVLGSNIDLLGEDYSSKTIGTSTNLFTGSLDGRGHTLSNLFTTGDGLFKEAGNGFAIKNLKLTNAKLNSLTSYKSLLVGIARESGVILNTTVSGDMDGGSTSAPIVGRSYQDSNNLKKIVISNVVSNVDIASTNTGSRRGGIIGESSVGTYITNTAYYGNMNLVSNSSGGIAGESNGSLIKNKSLGSLVTTSGTIGGILGILDTGDGVIENVLIYQNYTSMDISGVNQVAGAFGYTNDYPDFLNNAAIGGSINGSGDDNGGLIGANHGITAHYNLTDNTVDIAGTKNGGVFGIFSDYNIGRFPPIGNFWNIDSGITDARSESVGDIVGAIGKTTAELDDYSIYNTAGWDLWDTSLGAAALTNQLWVMSNNVRQPQLRWMLHPICQENTGVTTYNGIGAGTVLDPYLICFKDQLIDISVNGCDSNSSAGCASHYLLMNDIDLKGETFFPIGDSTNNFTGIFNGQNHIVSSMKINTPGNDNVGFFNHLDGLVQNLTLSLIEIKANLGAGGLANIADVNSLVKNVSVDGVIDVTAFAGGIAGTVNGKIINSHANVDITATNSAGTSAVGGVAGTVSLGGTIENTSSNGDISATGNNVGGFVGAVGGASNAIGIINDCYSTGGVISTSAYVGGFVGTIRSTNSLITRSFTSSTVNGGVSDIGGFVGEMRGGTISNSHSRGSVSGPGNLGGFVGLVDNAFGTSVLLNNFSLGTASSGDGFIGVTSAGTFTNNYWNSDTSGITLGNSAGEYDPLTDAQMEVSGNYTGWDFTKTWRVFTGGYPEVIKVD